MGELVKWKPNLDVTRRIDEALDFISGNKPVLQAPCSPPVPVHPQDVGSTQTSPAVVAMPRVCAVTDQPYMSYYVLGSGGHYRYSRPGQLTKAIYRAAYSGAALKNYRMDREDIDEETCAWCGASGYGAVFCTQCSSFTCWGTVVDNRFWRCRRGCGSAGELVDDVVEHVGVIPRVG
jgi:hypothetical protein